MTSSPFAKSRMHKQLIVGGVVSWIITVWLHAAWLPQELSIAVQLAVITCGQEPLVTNVTEYVMLLGAQ